MVRLERCVGLAALGLVVAGVAAGCGSDGPSGGSFESIASSIESPTGTVSASTAAEIGDEFEKLEQSAFAGGMRRDSQVAQASQETQTSCPAGGSMRISGSGNESSGRATLSYDDCCYEAGCCADGSGTMHYSSSADQAYTMCASFDLNYRCDGETGSLDYSGCLAPTGWVYVVEVDGQSFAVSGTYAGGSGTLEVRGANGSWTCEYESGSGHCVDEGGEEFDF